MDVGLERTPSSGGLLRRERQRRGKSLQEVARELRIPARVLGAIEEERHAELPPWPYLRGFLETYASHLGLDPTEVVSRFQSARREVGHGREGHGRLFRYPQPERFHWRDWTLPVALALGGAGLLAVRLFRPPEPPPPAAPMPAPAVLRESAQPPPAQIPAVGSPAGEAPAEAGVNLLVRSEGTTWVESAADGVEMERHDLSPGQNLGLTAREKLSVDLGDAGLLRLRVNGRELGFVGAKGETRRGLLFLPEKGREPARVEASPDVRD